MSATEEKTLKAEEAALNVFLFTGCHPQKIDSGIASASAAYRRGLSGQASPDGWHLLIEMAELQNDSTHSNILSFLFEEYSILYSL